MEGLSCTRAHPSPPEGPPVGPTWVGPRGAQVGGPTRGPSGWAHAGPKWAHVGPKPEIRDPKKSKKQKFSKSKSVLPKMSAIFFHAGIRRPRPIWGPPGPFFAWAGKIQKIAQIFPIFLGGPMGPIHPVWGPCCYPPEVGQ